MDFMNRGFQRPGPATTNNETEKPEAPLHKPHGSAPKAKNLGAGKLLNIAYISLLFSTTILIVAVVLSVFLVGDNKEEKFVDKTKLQAVFLNNGQVYFGKIDKLNQKYMRVANIYYLRVNQQVQPGQQANQNDVSLVKLGCELHGPEDSMLINREQIVFWENLKDDGQVAKAVVEFVKANPDGQKCEQQATTNNDAGSNPTTPATTSTNSTNAGSNAGTNNTNTTNNATNGTTNNR